MINIELCRFLNWKITPIMTFLKKNLYPVVLPIPHNLYKKRSVCLTVCQSPTVWSCDPAAFCMGALDNCCEFQEPRQHRRLPWPSRCRYSVLPLQKPLTDMGELKLRSHMNGADKQLRKHRLGRTGWRSGRECFLGIVIVVLFFHFKQFYHYNIVQGQVHIFQVTAGQWANHNCFCTHNHLQPEHLAVLQTHGAAIHS